MARSAALASGSTVCCQAFFKKAKKATKPIMPVVAKTKMKLLSIFRGLKPTPKIGFWVNEMRACLWFSNRLTIEKVRKRLTPSPKGLGAK